MTDVVRETVTGEGWAVGSIDGMGEGPGFRKVRRELGVTAFGVNAVVMPPGYASGPHFHDRQEELYLVQRGTVEFTFGRGESRLLGPRGPRQRPPRRCRTRSGAPRSGSPTGTPGTAA